MELGGPVSSTNSTQQNVLPYVASAYEIMLLTGVSVTIKSDLAMCPPRDFELVSMLLSACARSIVGRPHARGGDDDDCDGDGRNIEM